MRLIADLPLAGQTMVCRIVLEHRGMHVPSYGLQETESVHWYRKEYGAFQKPEVFHIPDDRSLDRDSFLRWSSSDGRTSQKASLNNVFSTPF